MSSLTALHILVQSDYGSESTNKLTINHRKKNDPALLHLNWVEAERWVDVLKNRLPIFDLNFLCREACSFFIRSNSLFTKLAGKGSDSLVANLSEDELQVFRNAGLLDDLPNLDTVKWWDEFKTEFRTSLNVAKTNQGRLAERWTMESEIKAVADLDIYKKPQWISLRSDNYGYDIMSYRKNEKFLPVTVLIEVKSFMYKANPRIFLTRNEWNKALESEDSYFFVVWCMEERDCKTFKVSDIMPHIPLDVGKGNWQNIEIVIDPWWSDLKS